MQTRNAGPTLDYIGDTFVPQPAWLAPLRAEGEAKRPGMQMSPYEGYLLSWLVRLTGAKQVLEIGTFMGGTALWMAEGGAEVTSIEFDAGYAECARSHIANSAHAASVKIEQADALVWLGAQEKKPRFDFLFLDAVKSDYSRYLDEALPLLKTGALIVADNTLLWGAVSGEDPSAATAKQVEAIRAFNTRIAKDFGGIMLPTIEGLTIGRL